MNHLQKILQKITTLTLLVLFFSPASLFAVHSTATFKNTYPEADTNSVMLNFWAEQGNAYCNGNLVNNTVLILKPGESVDCSFTTSDGATISQMAVRSVNMCAQLCTLSLENAAKTVLLAPQGNCAFVKNGNIFLIGPDKTGPAVRPYDPCKTDKGYIC